MSQVVEKLAAEGYLTPEQVERVGRRVAEFMKAAEEDPSFRAEALEKLAVFEHIPWKQTAGTLLAAAGIQAMGSVVSDLYHGTKSSIQKARSYKSMLDNNPDLAQADAQKVQSTFNTLHTFNPSYAADPNVAGEFVRNTIQMARMPIEQIGSIVKARADLARSEPGFDVGRLPVQALSPIRQQPHPGMPEAQLSTEEARGQTERERGRYYESLREQ